MWYLSLFLVLSFLIAGSASAQQSGWQQTSGPIGGNVRTVAASTDGQTVLAGLWNGNLYRYNPATDWQQVPSVIGLLDLSAQGNIIFAHSYDGLFQSYDFGSTWMPVVRGTFNSQLSQIVKGKDGLYFIANDSVYRSIDAGETWNFTGATGQGAHTIGYADGRLIVGGFSGVFSSTDRGTTWVRTEDDLPSGSMISSMATVMHDGEYTVWISVLSEGMYEFDADKLEWDKECDGLPTYGSGYPSFTKLFEANGKLYGVTEKHTYEFDFGIEEWKEVDHLAGKNLQAYGGKLYSSSSDGVEVSANGGASWTAVGNNFRFTNVTEFAVSRKAVLAVAQNGIFRTLDEGDSWTKTGDFYSEDITAGHGVAYAESLDGVMRSTDDGLTWELASNGIDEELYHLSTVSANSTAAFAGFYDVFSFHGNSHWNSGGIARSTDNGETWQPVNTGLANDGFAFAPINQIEAFDDAQFALAIDGLYRSTNNGDRWTKQQVNIDPVMDMFTQLVRTGRDTLYLVGLRSMFRSTDAGATWEPFSNGLQTELENHGTLLLMENTLFLKSYNMMGQPRLYKLEGDNWIPAALEMAPGVDVTTFFQFGSSLYAGTTEAGVWAKPITPASVKPDISTEISLRSYPNPFSTTSTVSFTLPQSSYVRAGLYDLTGKMVQELASGWMPEGTNTLAIQADALPAGSYVCRIITEQGVAQEQVVLLP